MSPAACSTAARTRSRATGSGWSETQRRRVPRDPSRSAGASRRAGRDRARHGQTASPTTARSVHRKKTQFGSGPEAYRWTAAGGMAPLGDLPQRGLPEPGKRGLGRWLDRRRARGLPGRTEGSRIATAEAFRHGMGGTAGDPRGTRGGPHVRGLLQQCARRSRRPAMSLPEEARSATATRRSRLDGGDGHAHARRPLTLHGLLRRGRMGGVSRWLPPCWVSSTLPRVSKSRRTCGTSSPTPSSTSRRSTPSAKALPSTLRTAGGVLVGFQGGPRPFRAGRGPSRDGGRHLAGPRLPNPPVHADRRLRPRSERLGASGPRLPAPQTATRSSGYGIDPDGNPGSVGHADSGARYGLVRRRRPPCRLLCDEAASELRIADRAVRRVDEALTA